MLAMRSGRDCPAAHNTRPESRRAAIEERTERPLQLLTELVTLSAANRHVPHPPATI